MNNIISELYPVNNEVRNAQLLDGLWRFCFDPEGSGEREGWQEKGIPGAVSMPVPASFSDIFTEAWKRDYCGDFWYETDIFLQEYREDRQYIIRFGSVTHRCTVWLNGMQIAEHEGGFLPVLADVTGAIRPGKNRLSVKANNELNETSIPCGATAVQKDGRKLASGYFDFFNYSGIQRSVWLEQIPAVSILDYSLSFELDGADAIVNYEVSAGGAFDASEGVTAVLKLTDADGNTAAGACGFRGSFRVENAHLWKVRGAYLYSLAICLEKDGSLLDRYDARVGIRTVKIDGEKILINGEPVYLKGFGKHEDFEVLGRGFNYAVAKRDYECMKWIGANCFRTSHYPYAEEWYRMADEEGFLIIDEVPGVGMMRSFANFAAAGAGASNGFFGDCPDVELLQKNHRQAVTEMILRDKHHPSVFAWSIFNEAETVTDAAHDYFAPLFDLARKLDPEKRPVTGVLEKTSSPERCKCYPLMDFICLNRYYGWYISGGKLEDAREQMVGEMDAWAAKKLNVPFLFTEFGTDTLDTLHKLPSVMWTQEYQQEYMEMNFSVFDSYPFVQGELAWNFADFQTGQGIMRVNGNKKGIFSRNRQPKAAAFTMKKRWEEK